MLIATTVCECGLGLGLCAVFDTAYRGLRVASGHGLLCRRLILMYAAIRDTITAYPAVLYAALNISQVTRLLQCRPVRRTRASCVGSWPAARMQVHGTLVSHFRVNEFGKRAFQLITASSSIELIDQESTSIHILER